ncbi:MAG: hypothetical protein HY908_13920 [Myxococcales bacterium]|nr:hypothetical protein [Myxococcales bacterium]
MANVSRTRLRLLALALVLVGCGGEETGNGATTTGTGGSGGATGTAGAGGASGGSGGSGGLPEWIPTPADVGFTPVAPVPPGEQILFNDWSFPDAVKSMAPDGTGAMKVFDLYRVWSLGVSRAGDRLALSCGDPDQEAHYGLTLGDAIQHSWVYDFATESLELVAHGNINDECHHFGPGDDALYLCRRYDFTPDLTWKGYRVGRISLPDKAFEFLTDEGAPTLLTLRPQVTPDGLELYFERIDIAGGSQDRSVWKRGLPVGTPSLVHAEQMAPVLSPDGQRYLFADTLQQSAIYSSRLDGSDVTLVVDRAASSTVYSPDGTRVAYLLWDDALACSHVEVVAADGSQATAPVRIRDCGVTGESVTELAWFVRP